VERHGDVAEVHGKNGRAELVTQSNRSLNEFADAMRDDAALGGA
jgi:hypothetical protein